MLETKRVQFFMTHSVFSNSFSSKHSFFQFTYTQRHQIVYMFMTGCSMVQRPGASERSSAFNAARSQTSQDSDYRKSDQAMRQEALQNARVDNSRYCPKAYRSLLKSLPWCVYWGSESDSIFQQISNKTIHRSGNYNFLKIALFILIKINSLKTPTN